MGRGQVESFCNRGTHGLQDVGGDCQEGRFVGICGITVLGDIITTLPAYIVIDTLVNVVEYWDHGISINSSF